MTRDDSIEMIVNAVQALLELDETEHDGPIDESTALLGERALIDSLGLVNVIIEVEQGVFDDHGASIIVVDERGHVAGQQPLPDGRYSGRLCGGAGNGGVMDVDPADAEGSPVALVTGARKGIGRSWSSTSSLSAMTSRVVAEAWPNGRTTTTTITSLT